MARAEKSARNKEKKMNWIKKLSLVTGGVLLGCSVGYFLPTVTTASAIGVVDPENEVVYKNNDETEYKTLDTSNGKIGIVSDVHFNANSSGVATSPFEHSIKYLKKACAYFRRVGAEVIILDGDIVDHARADNYQLLADTLVEIYGSKENAPELIFNLGNHEFMDYYDATGEYADPEGDRVGVVSLSSTQEVYGRQKQYLQDWVNYDIWDGVSAEGWKKTTVVRELNDVTVIGYNPDTATGSYSLQSVAYLDGVLAAATAKSDKPIVMSMHVPLGYYLAGGWCDVQQGIDTGRVALHNVLIKYPNVAVFTGHTHISTVHGRNISQDDGYTTVNVGPLVCMSNTSWTTPSDGRSVYAESETPSSDYKAVNLLSGELIASEGVLFNKANTLNEGLLLSFGENAMQIDHVNMNRGEVFSQLTPYQIPYGITSANKAEKFDYVVAEMKANAAPLTFAQGAQATLAVENGRLVVTFPSVEQYLKVEAYKIVLKRNDEPVAEKVWASDAFTVPSVARTYRVSFLKETYGVVTAANLSEYSVEIVPFDFFGNRFESQALRG